MISLPGLERRREMPPKFPATPAKFLEWSSNILVDHNGIKWKLIIHGNGWSTWEEYDEFGEWIKQVKKDHELEAENARSEHNK